MLLLSSLHSGVLLPSETISTELRLSQLESGLDSTRSTLMEILKLQMKIDKNKENVTGVVTAAVKSLQKKFDVLKDDLSLKLENKVKRADYEDKFLTEEFSSIKLTIARDLATVKVKVLQTKVREDFTITEKGLIRPSPGSAFTFKTL